MLAQQPGHCTIVIGHKLDTLKLMYTYQFYSYTYFYSFKGVNKTGFVKLSIVSFRSVVETCNSVKRNRREVVLKRQVLLYGAVHTYCNIEGKTESNQLDTL